MMREVFNLGLEISILFFQHADLLQRLFIEFLVPVGKGSKVIIIQMIAVYLRQWDILGSRAGTVGDCLVVRALVAIAIV
jgi:hypothetical protein